MIDSATDPRWLAAALGDLDRVLVDHAHCEKKAAATALSLIQAYPGRALLVRRLTALAIEELRHFRAVCERLDERGVALTPDRGDPYARALRALVRSGEPDRLLDRLLVAGLIEARSCERLRLLGEHVGEPGLAAFYHSLARAEAGHATLFRELAETFAPAAAVEMRLAELVAEEASIVAQLPAEPRIH